MEPEVQRSQTSRRLVTGSTPGAVWGSINSMRALELAKKQNAGSSHSHDLSPIPCAFHQPLTSWAETRTSPLGTPAMSKLLPDTHKTTKMFVFCINSAGTVHVSSRGQKPGSPV